MIGVPPAIGPSLHDKAIFVSEVTDGMLTKFYGGLGTVTTIAPLPAPESADSPQTLDAETLANILSPRIQ